MNAEVNYCSPLLDLLLGPGSLASNAPATYTTPSVDGGRPILFSYIWPVFSVCLFPQKLYIHSFQVFPLQQDS